MTWKNRNNNFLGQLQAKREAESRKEGQQEEGSEEQPQVNPYILGTRRKKRRPWK